MTLFEKLFPAIPALIGVIHVPALPGSPFDRGQSLEEIEAFCVEEARAFVRGGFDAVIVENAGDGPRPKLTPPETVAALGALTYSVRKAVPVPVGVSAGYDAISTLGTAVAAGASFIRAIVYLEAAMTPAGVIEGSAAALLRYRKMLGRSCAIFADIHLKSTVPLSPRPLLDSFRDATSSGYADALIVTGIATGSAPSPEEVAPLWAAAKTPLLIGSGVAPENAAAFAACSHGFIVGSYCKQPGTGRIDHERAAHLRIEAGRGKP